MAAKKLSFVTTGLSYGGAETQLVRLAVRLRQRGWQIEVASMLPPVAYMDVLEGQGITVHNLRMQRKIPDPRALIRLAAIVRRFRPSIVHAYMVHANLLARVCRLISPMPVLISSARNLTEGGLAREWAYRLTDPLSDLTTQVCRAGAERYIQRRLTPAHKMVYIPNGIETARFAPQPDMRARTRAALELGDAFTWLTIGRLEPQKDYPTLLPAFAQVVRRSDKPVQLLIVGQGALREAVEQQI
ncbi:MAG: glycosyltransferase, partial [Candidatus Caldarchaeum sp.]